ncbi:MAG TPA: SDR family oxidoreductase [Phycisphaerae bacterium]|nr:SDR family oxidoreductase [Phycisphaerae bacterium]HNU43712.1 SDR family oxidoreductase [Phycisphaerae bacterium]
MRVLVTGGAGFLGSHLCDRLLAAGHDVVALDNLFTGSKRMIAHLLGRADFEFIRHDVVNPIMLEVDWIFNLACPASPVHYQYNPVKTVKTSVMGTLNMLGLAKRVKARILQASTSEVYGDPQVHPQPEEYWGHVNPIGSRSCYDEGKRVAETLMLDYHRQNEVDIRIARIFNTYGPRMAIGDGRVASNFIVQALRGQKLTIYGDGTQTRCFCYVDDLMTGLLALMEYEAPDAWEPVNLGSTEERSMNDLVAGIGEVLGRSLPVEHLPLPHDDPVRRRPDLTRARTRLGWEPKIPLPEGLRRTVRYFQEVLQLGVGTARG